MDHERMGHDSPDLVAAPTTPPSEEILGLRDRLRRLVTDYREAIHGLKAEVDAARDGSPLGEFLSSAAVHVGIDADQAVLLTALSTAQVTLESLERPLDIHRLPYARWHSCGFRVGSRLYLAVPIEGAEDHPIGTTCVDDSQLMQLTVMPAASIEGIGPLE